MIGNEKDKSPSGSRPRHVRHALTSRKPLSYVGIPVLVLVFLSGILIAVVSGQPHSAAASTQPTPTVSAASTAVGTAAGVKPVPYIPRGGESGKAALALLGSNAMSLPGTSVTSAKTWSAGRGGAALKAVTSDVGTVTQEAGVRNFVLMKGGCRILAAGVRTAQAAPPIPQASLQSLYAKALTTLADGAAACQAAISLRPDGEEYNVTTENQTELHRATSDFASGAKDIYRATAEIQAVSRH